ncbi:hypothetical protein AN221_33730 [Streptomyces nanshensis]|uniref:Uncharacterized protein n=1 Tax=Streptomyces nanshensis TaxID=518642 RepID=A0A1E7LJY2_9ACTN|nr:hypothetical protein AN221_33730 [Streptomyces nanshensis]
MARLGHQLVPPHHVPDPQGDGRPHGDQPQGGHDLLGVLDRAGAGRGVAVADEADRLPGPLGAQVVEGVLQGGGHGVVVLRRHDDEAVRAVDDPAPAAGVLLVVHAGQRVLLLVQERQLQITDRLEHELHAEPLGVGCERVGQPPADGGAERVGAGAGDQDKNARAFRCHGNEISR